MARRALMMAIGTVCWPFVAFPEIVGGTWLERPINYLALTFTHEVTVRLSAKY